MPRNRTDVVICGAGPNGLMLAAELALAGIHPIVVDRLAAPSAEPRANGVIGQVVRYLDMRGLHTTLSGEAGPPKPMSRYIFSGLALDLAELPDNPMYGIGIPQPQLVRRLHERLRRLGVSVRWGHEVLDFESTETGARVTVAGPRGEYSIDTRFLVGADGGRSLVRKRAGIGFPGDTGTIVTRTGHVGLPAELRTPHGGIRVPGAGEFDFGHNRLETGIFMFAELDPGRPLVGVVEFGDTAPPSEGPMTFDELRAGLRRVLGADLPIQPPTGPGPHTLKRVDGNNTRLAERYRLGPVLLVGDAAHVHFAIGGPGLNLGLQDVANLGWKLAAQINGWAPAELLDSYETERHPLGRRVMMSTLAQTGLLRPGAEAAALRQLVTELLDHRDNTARIAALLSGTDTGYDIGDDHRLSGRMAPELDLVVGGGVRRVAELLHGARPQLVDLSGGSRYAEAASRWAERVDITTASPSRPAQPAAMLIRPDGYVAWATDDPAHATSGLDTALNRWFGTP